VSGPGGVLLDVSFALFLLVRSVRTRGKLQRDFGGLSPEAAAERRLALYRRIALRSGWLALPPLLLCALGRVSLAELGLVLAPGALGTSAAIALMFLAGCAVGSFRLRRLGPRPAGPMLESDHLTPRSPDELRWWFAVSLYAGVVEEIVFRGYLFWALLRLAQLSPRPLGADAQLLLQLGGSSLLFGLAHLAQGGRRALFTGCLGALFGLLYLTCHSLVPVMVTHLAFDMTVGLLARQRRELAQAAPTA
jgi:membrane protease YdiL (CAAX protease family)